jgi:hypothetical protein
VRCLLARVLPWTRFLPEGSTEETTAELVGAAQATRPLNTLVSLVQTLVEWRHTAEAYADPDLLGELTRDRDGDTDPVPCPAGDTSGGV